MTDRWGKTLHITFIDDKLNGAAICEGTVTDVATRTMTKVAERHDDVKRVSKTYPFGESDWPVELVYEHTVTLDGSGVTYQWRHLFRRPDEPWPMDEAVEPPADLFVPVTFPCPTCTANAGGPPPPPPPEFFDPPSVNPTVPDTRSCKEPS